MSDNCRKPKDTEGRSLGILFLGGAKRVAMGRWLTDASLSLGFTPRLYSYELSPYVPVASIAEIVVGKKWSDPLLFDDLRKVLSDKNIDIVIPFVDGAVEVAARLMQEGLAWSPVSSPELCRTMFDKLLSDTLFRSLSLPVPAKEGFPLIAKPRCGSASKGIRILDSAHDLDNLVDKDNYLIQNYISPRREITVDCYVSLGGRIITTVPRYRVETQGGEASVTRTTDSPRAEELARNTLSLTGLRGAVTIQLIEDLTDGSLMLMEINPRLGGGAVCACHAGANLPLMILRDFLGLSLSPVTDWNRNLLLTRFFSDVAFDLSSN